MTETDLIALYCFVDDFFQNFQHTDGFKILFQKWQGKRGPQCRLSISEVVTLNLVRFFLHIQDVKHFHKLVVSTYAALFPAMPNYENFLKTTNKSCGFILALLRYLIYLNQIQNHGLPHFVDSTPLPVCENRYINSHRVAKAIATRGKSTKGWFYGFKLHGVCSLTGTLEQIMFTTGSEHDSQAVEKLTEGLEGLFVADAGYLLKPEVLQRLYETHRRFWSATRKNMKRIMSEQQAKLLRRRNRIETVWGVLKERFQLVYHAARSITGLFRHYFYSIACFLISQRYPFALFDFLPFSHS